jgi:hypothetical protein
MSRWIVVAAAALLLASQPTSAQYIGIFLDPEAGSCAADVGPNPRVDLHLIAVLGGDVPEMHGAEFRIVGAPESWTQQNVLWVPDVGTTITVGNPLFPSGPYPRAGVGIAFSKCQTGGDTHRVTLGRIVLLGPPTADNVHLQVTTTTIWEDVTCPAVNRCDGPAYPYACVGGGEVVLNGPAPSSCQLAVEERTWTNIKALFR